MSAFPSIVNVPENLDFLIEFVNDPDFEAGKAEQTQAKRDGIPSFETDEEYKQYFINSATLAYLPDNKTRLFSLVRTLKVKRRLLEELLEDLPKLLTELACVKLVIEGKMRKKRDEEARRLELQAQKLAAAEQRRVNAEKRYKAATADWIGGKEEDEKDKKEDEILEMKDRVARELQKGRADIAAQQAALKAQQDELKKQILEMQQSFLLQAQAAATARAATVHVVPPVLVQEPDTRKPFFGDGPAPASWGSTKLSYSPKRYRKLIDEEDDEQLSSDGDEQLSSDGEELSKKFCNMPFSASKDGATAG